MPEKHMSHNHNTTEHNSSMCKMVETIDHYKPSRVPERVTENEQKVRSSLPQLRIEIQILYVHTYHTVY